MLLIVYRIMVLALLGIVADNAVKAAEHAEAGRYAAAAASKQAGIAASNAEEAHEAAKNAWRSARGCN